MKALKIITVLGMAMFLVAPQPTDAGVRKSGLTGAAFLKVGVGARAVALGSAYTTVTGDVNQIFWNPAGSALNSGDTQVMLSHNSWIADLSHDAVGYARDFGDLGTVGIGIVTLGTSGIESDRDAVPQFVLDAGTFTPNDNGSGNYDYRDIAVGVTWSRHITDRLDMGLTGKIVRQTIDGVSASAYAADFGAIYRTGFYGTRLGARINNLGSDLTFYDIGAPLPLIFSIGAATDIYNDSGMQVTVLADATKPQDGEQLLYTAVEAQFFEMLQLRTGYQFNYQGIEDEKVDEVDGVVFDAPRTEQGLTAGLGLDLSMGDYDATVDYAFTSFGILDQVHQFSLQFHF
ncbi:MAG: hypothetical protein CME10_10175 [Gemmatimonadetes bacterium]|nr:hypothetical protein [Gemmatimonadota bacterium]